MRTQSTPADIRRLIVLVERRLAAVGKAPSYDAPDFNSAWRAHLAEFRAIVDHLVDAEGAKYRPNASGAAHLRMAGVATSCTAGDAGLLRNWVTAARRRYSFSFEARPL